MTQSSIAVAAQPLTVDGADFDVQGTFDVINPATGAVFATAPAVAPGQLDAVFASAQAAYESWRRVSDEERRATMHKAADALEASAEELAPLLTAEQGKPVKESVGEFFGSAIWMRYFADMEIPREVVRDDELAFQEVVRRPMGVVAAITPWNFPIALAVWKIAPALRAGNSVVLKPSPYTPLATLAMGVALRNALPPGLLNVISGPDPLGASMVAHPVPRKISFTGSTATGKKVAVSAAEDLKRVTLELGGNDPAIVLADADIEASAAGIFRAAFGNSGQVCLAIKRVYAHKKVYADLVSALAEMARSQVVGDGMTEGVQMGPINNRPQFERVSELVRDAVEHGARPVSGGAPLDGPGYFFAPTVLDHIDDGVRIVDEEQFGPALPVLSFDDDADVIARANATHFGLTASVWSGDVERAAAFAPELDCGQVSFNVHGGGMGPNLPFGGHKWSGVGVENGIWGLNSFTEIQVVSGPGRRK